PYGDPALRRNRPTLAPPDPGRAGGLLDLDGFFGLHTRLSPLQELFQEKVLAIVPACGSPDRTLSHFEAMQTAERGVSDGGQTATGWIARHLNCREPILPSPLRAVAIAETLPRSLEGNLGALAIRSLSEYQLRAPEAWNSFPDVLAALYGAGGDPLSVTGSATLKLLSRIEKLLASPYTPSSGAVYPEGNLGAGLREVARLIKADLGLEVAEVDLGGWDSHAAQSALLDPLMDQLARALHAFYTDLDTARSRVTLVAMSEFGRRVHENGAAGTDHGQGTVTFVLGSGIRGGRVYGSWPGLGPEQLDQDGNLRIITDFRQILGEVVLRRLQNRNLDAVFPGWAPRFLGLAKEAAAPGSGPA
ncbi:MAG: DUF1501 domain-containing protein, partial [Armatimonadetes bacterium]|nr:DUF1501 domain-containing protein [Armatimonadota bacterium]